MTPSLLDLQRGLRRALLDGPEGPEAAAALAAIAGDGWTPDGRLGVHRNTIFTSLTDVLASAFPVVRRLVDERFFAYAADAFIRRMPPARPSLAEYGRRFPDFLAVFPPCRTLVYLADVARLEWALHDAAHAPDAASRSLDALAGVPSADTQHLRFRLMPSMRYVTSRWPVDRIWRANSAACQGEPDDEVIDLASGSARVEIRRTTTGVVIRALTPDAYAFREALSQGGTLVAAAEAALAVDPRFDLASALATLFGEGAVAEVTRYGLPS